MSHSTFLLYASKRLTRELDVCRTGWPSGFRPVPLKMDGEGMTPAGLTDVLANWDVAARDGMTRYASVYAPVGLDEMLIWFM